MTRLLGLLLVVSVAVAGIAVPPAAADNEALEPFFGTYAGQSGPVGGDKTSIRDLGVRIEPGDGDGFRLTWTTVRHKSDGRRKETEIAIEFLPVSRKGIFSSAMRRNKFGHRIPLNPLKGDPYVWARVNATTSTVYAMIITDDGGYEMQVYDRTLTDEGLDLVFSRVRDGENLRTIKAILRRTGD